MNNSIEKPKLQYLIQFLNGVRELDITEEFKSIIDRTINKLKSGEHAEFEIHYITMLFTHEILYLDKMIVDKARPFVDARINGSIRANQAKKDKAYKNKIKINDCASLLLSEGKNKSSISSMIQKKLNFKKGVVYSALRDHPSGLWK